jgi:hypothetical protein
LCCSRTCNHPQEELAKFGYRLERKIERFKESCYIFDDMLEPIVKKIVISGKTNPSFFTKIKCLDFVFSSSGNVH